MKKLLIALLLGLAILPFAASGQSQGQVTYRKWGVFGGYKDKQTGPNAWRVWTGVNGAAPEGSASWIALYRAAELANLAGFRFFQIVYQKSQLTYLRIGNGDFDLTGPGGAELEIIATNDPAPPSICRAAKPEYCMTLDAKMTMDQIAPRLKFPKRKSD